MTDASGFCALILKEPVDGHCTFDKQTADHRRLTIQEFKWDSTVPEGKGSYAACLEHTHPSRLEPLFIPKNLDFALPLGTGQRYNRLVSKGLWVPQYQSDKAFWVADRPKRGNFEEVKLVCSSKTYSIGFEEDSDIPPNLPQESSTKGGGHHLETTKSCNKNLQQLLSILTGWTLIVIFSTTRFKQKKRMSPNKGPADVLVFQRNREKRIVIRSFRPSDTDGNTIDWMTATLIDDRNQVHVNSEKRKLDVLLASMHKGQTLALSSVSAAGEEVEIEPARWLFTVEDANVAQLYLMIVDVGGSLPSTENSPSPRGSF